jgi:arsenate reductase-like glutaredoxin family protein
MLNPKINFNINKSCSCFIREIVNLEEHLNDSNAPRFIDLIKENNSSIKIDSEAEKLIENLKNVKIPYKLDSSNIFYYKVKWKNNQIDKDELNAYLEKFGKDFFNQMIRLIEDAFKTEQVKNAISNEIYFKFGLINERDKKFTSLEMDLIQEFKDLILELSNHATEFRENNSK